ncbi:hypothetical protein ACFQZ2_05935 [Streptomonospora algeriensis]|uniref:Uncharacterized protein n=1 Tax=Streptomonospora algeriensis TaxID=995084 RepID=A0ABW3BCC3_9ACTN
MSEPTETPAMQTAIDNAARLLTWAEAEDNLPRGEHLVACADGWINIAALLAGHEPTT